MEKKTAKKVFASGSFDLFHSGHAEYLKRSGRLGDKLDVYLTSDEEVRAKKGDGYPIYSFEHRKFIIENFRLVSNVYESPVFLNRFHIPIGIVPAREEAVKILSEYDIVAVGWDKSNESWAIPLQKECGFTLVSVYAERIHTSETIEKIRKLK